jgi:hypothetical protein
MPNISLTVQDTKQSILRPVVSAVVNQIKKITGLGDGVTVRMPGDLERMAQPGSSLGEDANDGTQSPYRDGVSIEVSEDYITDRILSTVTWSEDMLPIFSDRLIGVYLKPIMSPTEVTISIKFKSASSSAVARWRDDIRMRTSMGREQNIHRFTYHYAIPEDLLKVIHEIHRLRESVAGYGEDFSTYLKNNSTTSLTEIANLNGQEVSWAVAETQGRIVGRFDFEAFPEKPVKDDDGQTFTIGFNYKFSFDKAIACNLRYPPMVHNQVLVDTLIPDKSQTDEDNYDRTYTASSEAFGFFESYRVYERAFPNYTIAIPAFDEFTPDGIVPKTLAVFNALCAISDDNKRDLFNFNELGDTVIDEDILNFIMKSEYPFMAKPYASILHVSLYRSMSLTNDKMITVDSLGSVVATEDLSVRQSHRARFSIVGDLNMLDKKALVRLRAYSGAANKLVAFLRDVERTDPQETYNKIYGIGPNVGRMRTVMTTGVIAMSNTHKPLTAAQTQHHMSSRG